MGAGIRTQVQKGHLQGFQICNLIETLVLAAGQLDFRGRIRVGVQGVDERNPDEGQANAHYLPVSMYVAYNPKACLLCTRGVSYHPKVVRQ